MCECRDMTRITRQCFLKVRKLQVIKLSHLKADLSTFFRLCICKQTFCCPSAAFQHKTRSLGTYYERSIGLRWPVGSSASWPVYNKQLIISLIAWMTTIEITPVTFGPIADKSEGAALGIYLV